MCKGPNKFISIQFKQQLVSCEAILWLTAMDSMQGMGKTLDRTQQIH